MSIADEIQRIQGNINDMYDSLESMGATMPVNRNSANLVTSFNSSALLSDFIPSGTIINVKLDGSGDFTTLTDAANYIKGKWSNGGVTIKLSDGTHQVANTLTFSKFDSNIPVLKILGTSRTNTIINSGITSNYNSIIKSENCFNLVVENLTLTCANYTASTNLGGVCVIGGGFLRATNLDFINVNYPLYTLPSSTIFLTGTNNFTNGKSVTLSAGDVRCSHDTTFNIKNFSTAWYAEYGGTVILTRPKITYTSVTTKATEGFISNHTTNCFVVNY